MQVNHSFELFILPLPLHQLGLLPLYRLLLLLKLNSQNLDLLTLLLELLDKVLLGLKLPQPILCDGFVVEILVVVCQQCLLVAFVRHPCRFINIQTMGSFDHFLVKNLM